MAAKAATPFYFFFVLLVCLAILPALKTIADESSTTPSFESPIDDEFPDVASDNKAEESSQTGFDQEETTTEGRELPPVLKYDFQSDVAKIMSIIINSIYSKKEVFLREMISNASDALDKIRYNGIRDPSQLGEGEVANLQIRIKADPETNTLTIQDTGIGMTKDDLINKLGNLGKSGTKEFLEAVKTADMNLIGQFGVGFYSAFLVANRVSVFSKHNDDKQYIWESVADNNYYIMEDPAGNTLGRGTKIVLHLKFEAREFSDPKFLQDLIKRYSEFINFPIYLWSSEDVTEEVVVEDEKDAEQVFLDEIDTPTEPKTKSVTKTVWKWVLQNESRPIWTRNPKTITEDEYVEFYKTFARDPEDPLYHVHFVGEGEIDFKAILYIPATSTRIPRGQEKSDPQQQQQQRGLRLYVKRVFITDDFSDMLPAYLNFIKGMIDSDNLPLNVSREILQQDRTLSLIKKKLARKVITMLQDLSEDKEKYEKFWQTFATNIKSGIVHDTANRHRLSKLLRYYSTKTQELTSLDAYVSRMKEGQNNIYFIAGEDKETLINSPLIEKLLARDYEVIVMTDPIDEWSLQNLPRFDSKYPLINVAKEGFKIEGLEEDDDEEQKAKAKEIASQFRPLLSFLKRSLKGKIARATISQNLVKTPSAITSGSFGFTANMERLMKAQSYNDKKQLAYMKSQRILEINPSHPLIKELNRRVIADKKDEVAADVAELLYETASLQSGFTIENPTEFAARILRMIKQGLNLDFEEGEVDAHVVTESEKEITQKDVEEVLKMVSENNGGSANTAVDENDEL